MKTKEIKTQNTTQSPEQVSLSLVAEKLKGRVLFPEKIERAKAILKQVKHSTL